MTSNEDKPAFAFGNGINIIIIQKMAMGN